MYWQQRLRTKRVNKNAELEATILSIRKDNPNYGYRRLWGMLRTKGIIVNKKRVQRIVQKLGLQVTSFTRKSRKYSSYKGTVGRIATNRIRRRFYTSIPYQKITTDTTEFKYYEQDSKGRIIIKKLYLDPFMDLYNRELISYSISAKPSAESILTALDTALKVTESCKYRRTFHSDQGWAYQMKAYTSQLKKHRVFQSMSRKGNCLDNSPMENFFGLLKQEIYYGNIYRSYEELAGAIIKYIDYYNNERIKEELNWKSPVQFRKAG